MYGCRGWIGGVVVGLNVRICKGLVQAGNDRLKGQLWGTSESVGQNVSGGNLDGLLEEIVFEDDETSVQGSDVAHDIVPVLQNLLRRNGP